MRKGQRFTPARLTRWVNAGRGTGTLADYQPWHQVTRDDPGSRGRSHLINWRFGRLHHLLSDLELVAFGFASMLPTMVDLREQFPLAREDQPHELSAYQVNYERITPPGTVEVARELGYRHPIVRKSGTQELWVLTTDLLITLRNPMGRVELLAVSLKYAEEAQQARKRQLLEIEREYWRRRGVSWLLITPSMYPAVVANAVRVGMPWVIGQPSVGDALMSACAALSNELNGRTWQQAVRIVGESLRIDSQSAQSAIWQCLWAGTLPVELSRPIRPSERIELISTADFWLQNPIASRRTTWSI